MPRKGGRVQITSVFNTACHNFGQAVAIAFASPVVNLTTYSPSKHFSSRIDYRSSVIYWNSQKNFSLAC